MALWDIEKMTKNNLIETIDLTKIYQLKSKKGHIKALNNINISVSEGEIFGLLGPNGAGKTTLIQILTTLLQPTSGYALIDGHNIIKRPYLAKSKISLMLGSDMLYYRITAYDNLKFFCKIYNVPNFKQKIFEMAKEFGLERWLKQYVENFSSGMKMKLALLRTLILDRDILFLDEPTLGLDVKSIDFIIKKIRDTKKTIFLTSHDMNVVEKLCKRVAFIKEGNILKIGTRDEISSLLQTEIDIVIEVLENREKLKIELRKQEFVTNTIESKDGIIISLKERKYYNDLLHIFNNYTILKIKELEPSLEELFRKII